eukprot:6114012-Heterocapsa_arctica.AAC.1
MQKRVPHVQKLAGQCTASFHTKFTKISHTYVKVLKHCFSLGKAIPYNIKLIDVKAPRSKLLGMETSRTARLGTPGRGSYPVSYTHLTLPTNREV